MSAAARVQKRASGTPNLLLLSKCSSRAVSVLHPWAVCPPPLLHPLRGPHLPLPHCPLTAAMVYLKFRPNSKSKCIVSAGAVKTYQRVCASAWQSSRSFVTRITDILSALITHICKKSSSLAFNFAHAILLLLLLFSQMMCLLISLGKLFYSLILNLHLDTQALVFSVAHWSDSFFHFGECPKTFDKVILGWSIFMVNLIVFRVTQKMSETCLRYVCMDISREEQRHPWMWVTVSHRIKGDPWGFAPSSATMRWNGLTHDALLMVMVWIVISY